MHFILVINIINSFLSSVHLSENMIEWEEWDSNPRPGGLEPPAITGYAIFPKKLMARFEQAQSSLQGRRFYQTKLHERIIISSIR